ncbi:MAG: prepilin peptidase [Erysipelotrichia bacterium]|nr:prepilin peptidase [Erysipelotrichia bacterium]
MSPNEALHFLLTVFFLIFGSLLGSFSNVVILRMASGKSVIFPPSACPKCDHQLHTSDLFPVFSWLWLRGKCRYCQTPISCQYPLVEASIALILGLSFYKLGLSPAFISLAAQSVIWFIAGVIFVRNEVQKPAPFIWAIMYFIVLNFLVNGHQATNQQTLLIPAIAALAGIVASFKQGKHEFWQWGGLAFLLTFSLAHKSSIYIALPVLIVAALNNNPSTSKTARIVFFGIQVIAIFASILL